MPEPSEEVKKRIEEFLQAYGKLVEEYKIDFVNYPQWIPDGEGGWKMIMQTQPMDTTNLPQKSPFVAS